MRDTKDDGSWVPLVGGHTSRERNLSDIYPCADIFVRKFYGNGGGATRNEESNLHISPPRHDFAHMTLATFAWGWAMFRKWSSLPKLVGGGDVVKFPELYVLHPPQILPLRSTFAHLGVEVSDALITRCN